MDDNEMEMPPEECAPEKPDFRWPEPPLDEAWWLYEGSGLKLEESHIRFLAALYLRGGLKSRANLAAARDAGLNDLNPLQAFQLANKKASRKLLQRAEEVRKGKYKPVDHNEMFERVDWLIRTGSPTDVGRAIELRIKLETADANAGKDTHDYSGSVGEARIVRDILVADDLHGATTVVLMNAGSKSLSRIWLLHDVHHKVMTEPYGRQIWEAELAKHSSVMRQDMRDLLADPTWQLNIRKQVWGEIARKPLAPLDPNAVDWRVVGRSKPVVGNGIHVATAY